MASLISGMHEFRLGLKHGMLQQRAAITVQMETLGQRMVAQIRANAPRITGALAASVRYQIIETNNGVRLEILIGDKVAYYAAHVEYGDAHAPAHPFARPVAMAYQKVIPVEINASIVNAWSKP